MDDRGSGGDDILLHYCHLHVLAVTIRAAE
jgi:hypothetical protein